MNRETRKEVVGGRGKGDFTDITNLSHSIETVDTVIKKEKQAMRRCFSH